MTRTAPDVNSPQAVAPDMGTAPGATRPSNGVNKPGGAVHPRKAYELTDEHGHSARVWRVNHRWTVEATDLALRDRVLQALLMK